MDDGELADSLERPPVGIETPVAPSSPADSLPEEVTDDDIFGEEDFEAVEKAFPADDSPYWDVEDVHDVEDEESPPRKVLRDPGEPSKQELEEHRIDHIPYRSWCPYCVRGRGTGAQHRRIKEESSIPVFGFDYLHGAQRVDEGGEVVKILVAKCHLTKCLFAHVVPQKGMDPQNYAVERLKRDIMWLGHSKIILKTDNEHAIMAVLKNTLKALRIEGVVESSQESHPAAYDPSSNGSTEVACRTVGGMVATLRACLEGRLTRQMPVTHGSFAWLVEHAAWLHTIKKKQSDGLTAYQRLRGMSFGPKLLGFCP